jgi:hypothetical protein
MAPGQHRIKRARTTAVLAAALALVFAAPASAAAVVTGTARPAVHPASTLATITADAITAAPAISEPAANRDPSPATIEDCATAPGGAACSASALADINSARAAEGVGPMVLPASFASLTIPQQLMVVANLERIGRGLAPALGLSANLDATATGAAAMDTDPSPSQFNGDALTSNWAGGTSSPLLADFLWMYDDGPGSGNEDCQQTGDSGCWGHRRDILYSFDDAVVMGAAEVDNTAMGASIAEVFVGGDTATGKGQADAPLDPTWAQLWGGQVVAQPASVNIRRAAELSIHASHRKIRPGASATITGRLRATGGGSSGQVVALEARTLGRGTRIVARHRTRPSGVVRFHVSPRRTTVYWLVFGGSVWLQPASTHGAEVHVRRRHGSG